MGDIHQAATKFDPARAADYARQARIALAGYDACHDLAACLLSASLGAGGAARILVVGAGGLGREITMAGQLEAAWRFTAVDPSPSMLDLAMAHVATAGLSPRTASHLGQVEDLAEDGYDAATLIGVLHHLPGDAAKAGILKAIAARLKPGAPLILACNHHAYASQPLLLKAWGIRWRQHGASPDEVEARLATILRGADPPQGEEAVAALLARAGLNQPLRFFGSLFWGAWITWRSTD